MICTQNMGEEVDEPCVLSLFNFVLYFHKEPTPYKVVSVWGVEGLCVTLQHSKDTMPLVYISDMKVSWIQGHGVRSAQCWYTQTNSYVQEYVFITN